MAGRKNAIAIGLFSLGLLLAGLGLFQGEAAIVTRKAVRVCLECIGIG